MATALSRGSSATAGATATWASTTNAYDGTVGTTPGTFATWVNASRSASGSIQVKGYSFAAVPAGATINSVTAAINHKETSTSVISNVTVQLQDSTGANIGSAVAGTRSTSAHTDTLTLGTPTLAQVQAGLWVLVTITRSNSTTSTTFSLDYVDLTVAYTGPDQWLDSMGAGNTVSTGGVATWQHPALGPNVTAVTVEIATLSTAGASTLSATFGGISMTQIGFVLAFQSGTQYDYNAIFGLLKSDCPGGVFPTGAQTVVATASAPNGQWMAANSFAYKGIGSFGTAQTATGSANPWTQTITGTSAGQLIAQTFGGGASGNPFTGYSQTERYDATSSGFPMVCGDAPGGGTVTFSVSNATSQSWGAVAVPLLPVVAPSGGPAQFFAMF